LPEIPVNLARWRLTDEGAARREPGGALNLSTPGHTNSSNPKHLSWNEFLISGLVTAWFGQGSAMAQRFQPRRSEEFERIWLSALVEAMDEVSCLGPRDKRCDRALLDAVIAQLAGPAPIYLCGPQDSA
jgi:hypothetical protein